MKLLVIIAVVLLFYWRTLKYHGIIDDIDHIKKPGEKTPKFWLRLWEHFYGIKITNLKLAHAFNIAVHAVVCCLIYQFFGSNNIAFLTSLLFAINPVNNQSAIWLSGRCYATSTALLLMGMIFVPALPIFYGLANWWSINTLFAPALFLVLKPHWLGLVIPLGLLFIRKKAKDSYAAGIARYNGASDVMGEKSLRKLIICLKTLGYYFTICLFPVKLGMCHAYLSTFGLSQEETDHYFKLDIFFFIGLSVIGVVVANFIHPFFPPLFGLFWFVIFCLQWLNFVVITHLITERYIYLANVGLMWFLANIIIGTPFMWVFLTLFAVRLYYFTPVYKSYMTYWASNTIEFPNVAMGWNQLGLAQLQFGNSGSALDSWIRGVQERPNDFRCNFNTANLLMGSGMVRESVKFIKAAEENLDKRNNYDLWKNKVEVMKEEVRKRGVEI